MADAKTCISAAPLATLAPLAALTLQMLQFTRTYKYVTKFPLFFWLPEEL